MQREMTKLEKILDNIALTNLALLIVTISAALVKERAIETLPIIIRHVFLFLRHHAMLFSFINFGMMFIAACMSVAIGNRLGVREKEYSEKYVLSNDANTKSRLELIKLQERCH